MTPSRYISELKLHSKSETGLAVNAKASSARAEILLCIMDRERDFTRFEMFPTYRPRANQDSRLSVDVS